MGVTIHYQGRLRQTGDFERIVKIGREFALRKNAEVLEISSEKNHLIRVKDGRIDYYDGPTIGMMFCLHKDSEPIRLEFDPDGYMSGFCKTQFAGVSTHVETIQFLRLIEPYFEEFEVLDEGGFWKEGDLEVLETKLAFVANALDVVGGVLRKSDGSSWYADRYRN